MNNDTQKNIKYEEFKAELLRWKNEHIEEYNRFARQMQSADEGGFFKFYKMVVTKIPKLSRQWQSVWDSDSIVNFNDIELSVRESSLPGDIVRDFADNREWETAGEEEKGKKPFWSAIRSLFGHKPERTVRISAPLVLSWLYYGQSFETMFDRMERTLRSPHADSMDRQKCTLVGRQVIKASIRGGFRTEEDWDRYFSMKKAMASGDISDWAMADFRKPITYDETSTPNYEVASIPDDTSRSAPGRRKAEDKPLIEYLNCENKEAVIAVIRRFIIANNTGNGLALPFFALEQLELFDRMIADKEYSDGLMKQFGDIKDLKSKNSCRQAMGNLRKEQYIMVNKKQCSGPLLDSDEIAPKLARLKEEISEAASIRGKNQS